MTTDASSLYTVIPLGPLAGFLLYKLYRPIGQFLKYIGLAILGVIATPLIPLLRPALPVIREIVFYWRGRKANTIYHQALEYRADELMKLNEKYEALSQEAQEMARTALQDRLEEARRRLDLGLPLSEAQRQLLDRASG